MYLDILLHYTLQLQGSTEIIRLTHSLEYTVSFAPASVYLRDQRGIAAKDKDYSSVLVVYIYND